MCGIAGWLTPAGAPSVSADWLRPMLTAIAHRGPDAEGSFHQRTIADSNIGVALGHRRLSIIDLAGGMQPMEDAAAGLALVYNGEVYNYRELREELRGEGVSFATDSDTEVVLRACQRWGTRAITRFRGMFAFALWDARRRTLLLARDRFGKKPLFLAELNGTLFFASEIAALRTIPSFHAEVDLDAVWEYIRYRYVPAPRTLYRGVRKVAAGSYVLWSDGKLSEQRYYDPPDGHPREEGPLPRHPVEAFAGLLDEAVKLRMVSDVPFGAFLSGGIDSSAVVALMSRHSSARVKTFSIGFAESNYSELEHARTVARAFNTEHHELTISSAQMMDLLPTIVRFRGASASEPADIPLYLLAKEAAKSVKMVLTGEGADEILAGYSKHVFERFVPAYQLVPASVRRQVLEPLVHALPYGFKRTKIAAGNLGLSDPADRHVRWFGALSREERAEFMAFTPSCAESATDMAGCMTAGNTLLRSLLYFDQTSWLPDNLLERGDRMTMAASIEARMPFMDDQLAAFVSRLPDTYRIRGLRTKWLLYQAMKGILPASILDRSKAGFSMPINLWLRGEMRGFLMDHLTGPDSKTRDYYRPQALKRVLTEHMDGRQNHEKLLWALLNLEVWHRVHL